MAADSPSGNLKRPAKFGGSTRSSDDDAKAAAKGKATQHGGVSLAKFAFAATAALLCGAAVKISSASSPHPGHAQLKSLITDGKWRHAEIDHLYTLGDEMQEAIGLVRRGFLPCIYFSRHLSSLPLSLSRSLETPRPKKTKTKNFLRIGRHRGPHGNGLPPPQDAGRARAHAGGQDDLRDRVQLGPLGVGLARGEREDFPSFFPLKNFLPSSFSGVSSRHRFRSKKKKNSLTFLLPGFPKTSLQNTNRPTPTPR